MKNSSKIISNYLSKKVFLSFFPISLILSLIIFGNQFFIVISQSLNEGLYTSEILPLMSLKFVRDIPFIIGLSFTLSMTYVLNSLYKNSELVVLNNAGFGDTFIIRLFRPLISLFFFVILIVSFFVVPLAQNKISTLKQNAQNRPDFIFFREGVFQSFNNKDVTLYSPIIENFSDSDNQELNDLFIYFELSDRLIIAEKGYKEVDELTGNVLLKLINGITYTNISLVNEFSKTRFKNFDINLFSENNNKERKRNAEEKTMFELINSNDLKDKAEIFYRLSIPVSLIILVICAVFFSKTDPRAKRNFSLGYSLLAFIVYYNMIIYSKSIIKSGDGNIYFNILLPHMPFILLILFILVKTRNIFHEIKI